MNNTNQQEFEEYKKHCQQKKMKPSLTGFLDWKRDQDISLKGWQTRKQQTYTSFMEKQTI